MPHASVDVEVLPRSPFLGEEDLDESAGIARHLQKVRISPSPAGGVSDASSIGAISLGALGVRPTDLVLLSSR